MTLALAIRYPIGSKQESDGLEFAILLATDSRYTYYSKKGDIDFGDRGAKLWLLKPTLGCVIAGCVKPAQAALAEIDNRIRRIQDLSPQIITKSLSDACRTIRKTEGQNHRPFHIVLARVNDRGEIFIIKASSDRNLDISPKVDKFGGYFIGHKKVISAFEDELGQKRVNLRGSYRNPLMQTPTTVVSALYALIESGNYSMIGGPIQSVIITRHGYKEFNLVISKTGGNEWQHITEQEKQIDRVPLNQSDGELVTRAISLP